MHITGKSFEALYIDVVDRAYKVEFARSKNVKRIKAELDAMTGVIGKMHNNRKNVHYGIFERTHRLGRRRTKSKIITRLSGQQEMWPAR
jgi:hypothetical protein